MPANVHEKTGISYGVIDARKVPDLWDQITADGKDLTLEDVEGEVRLNLTSRLGELDAEEIFRDAKVSEIEDEDDRLDAKEEALVDELAALIRSAVDIGASVADGIASEAIDLFDIDSGTFSVQEVAEQVLQALHEEDYFVTDDCGEHEYEYEDEGFKYRLARLGGAPLVWVIESPYVTYCRSCSPCIPNAGDLDNCVPENEANSIAYCVDPDDLEDTDKPYVVRRITGSDIGDIVFQRTETE